MFKKLLLSCVFAGTSCLGAFSITMSQSVAVQEETSKDPNVVINVNIDESVENSYIEIRYSSEPQTQVGSITYKTSYSGTAACTFSTLEEVDKFCKNFQSSLLKSNEWPKNISVNVVTSFAKQDVLQVLYKYFNNHAITKEAPKVGIFSKLNEERFDKPNEKSECGRLPFAQRISSSDDASQTDENVDQQKSSVEKYWNEFAGMMKSVFEKDSDNKPFKKHKRGFKKPKRHYHHAAVDSDITIKYTRRATPSLDMAWYAGDFAENKDIMLIITKSLEYVLSTYLDRRVDCDVRDGSFTISVNNSHAEWISEDVVLRIIRGFINNNEYRENVFSSVAAKLQSNGIRLDDISVGSVNEVFNTIFQNDPVEITITLPKGRR